MELNPVVKVWPTIKDFLVLTCQLEFHVSTLSQEHIGPYPKVTGVTTLTRMTLTCDMPTIENSILY